MFNRFYWTQIPRTNIISISLAALLGGLIWARFGASTSVELTAISFLLLPFSAKRRWPVIVAAILIGLNIGLWRGQQVYSNLLIYENLYGQKVHLQGRVGDDAAYSYRGQIEFHISEIVQINGEANRKLSGRIRVRGFGAIGIRRGDIIEIKGKLYEGFGNRQGSISYAEINILTRQPNFVEKIRSKFFAGVNTALPEPNSSLGLGFLVGLRTLLPDNLLGELSATGLTHIVAVSGYNLTILVRVMRRLFAKKSVYLSIASSAFLIIGFLMVTGLSPSISRAAVVSGFALTAWFYGRSIKPLLLILLSAAITALFNPFYAWYDLGWYLSFAAFFGVLILAPIITKRLFKSRPKLLAQVAIETISAQIMALPIIAVIFNELSLISLLANIIIVPLIPFAMLLTFIAGMGGMIGPLFAGWVAWPANFILTFMTDMISLMASVPWALTEIEVDWGVVSVFYAIILGAVIVARTRIKSPLSGTEIIE